jgi:arylsulfatase A-like enzyme
MTPGIRTWTALLVCCCAFIGATRTVTSQAQPAQARPNVLLILTDDLDAELGTLDYMPNLRRLLTAEGVTFENAFVTNSLCCPSRATLLRGQYTHGHGVYTNMPPTGGFEKFSATGLERSTLATWLQDAGYLTALLGKYLNGYPGTAVTHVPAGWTEWFVPARGNGYAMFNYTINENGTLRSHAAAADDYITDVLREKAKAVVRRAATEGKPFFVEVATYAPHAPATPAPRHAAMFPDLKAPRTASFNEADVSDKPGSGQRALLGAQQLENLDRQYRLRVLSMQAVDEMIADLIGTLEQTGQLARTYIIFTSDNGFHLGQHRLPGGKTTAYEEDIHVPLLVRGPGVPKGRSMSALVANVDLAPTIAELAGVKPPPFVDGRSIVPLLHGKTQNDWRTAVLIESYPGNGPDVRGARGARAGRGARAAARRAGRAAVAADSTPAARYIALRTDRYTFVLHANGAQELYDLRADPDQLSNLAGRTNQATLQALSSWARAMHQCQGAQCRNVEARQPEAVRPALDGGR